MTFRHEVTYDAPPLEVYEMLADAAFREASGAERAVDVQWPAGERG